VALCTELAFELEREIDFVEGDAMIELDTVEAIQEPLMAIPLTAVATRPSK